MPKKYELKAQQRLFCDEYIANGCANASAAARKAGYKSYYHAPHWLEEGHRDYKPEIVRYISDKLQAIEDKKIAKAEELMKFLQAVYAAN